MYTNVHQDSEQIFDVVYKRSLFILHEINLCLKLHTAMSKKASLTLIGSFLVGALVIIIFSIYFFASQTLFGKKDKYILYFPQSVNGLDVGVAVRFKGVPIGYVSAILLHFEGEKEYVPVVIEVPKRILKRINFDTEAEYIREIEKGLRGSLGLQSFLTGKYFVDLDYFPEEEAVFVGKSSPYREIPTVKSNYEKMWIAAREVLDHLRIVDFKGVADGIKTAADTFDSKLKELDAKIINEKLVASLDEVKKAATSFDDIINPSSPDGGQLSITLEEVSKTARSIRGLTDYLERNPNALLTGKKSSNE